MRVSQAVIAMVEVAEGKQARRRARRAGQVDAATAQLYAAERAKLPGGDPYPHYPYV